MNKQSQTKSRVKKSTIALLASIVAISAFAGGASASSTTFKNDTKAPSISIKTVHPSNFSENKPAKSVTHTLTVQDTAAKAKDISGIQSIVLKDLTGASPSQTLYKSKTKASAKGEKSVKINVPFKRDGQWQYIATDKAGNVKKVQADTVWIDNISPEIDGYSYDAKNKRLTITLWDNKRLDSYTFDKTTKGVQTIYDDIRIENVEAGSHTFTVRDLAGNTAKKVITVGTKDISVGNSVTANVSANYDHNIKPTIARNAKGIEYIVTIRDTSSSKGIQSVKLVDSERIDASKTLYQAKTKTSVKDKKEVIVRTKVNRNGQWALLVTDKSGQVNTIRLKTSGVDGVKPKLLGYTYNKSSKALALDLYDNQQLASYSVDNKKTNVTYQRGEVTVKNSKPGKHTINVTDAAGNVSTYTINVPNTNTTKYVE